MSNYFVDKQGTDGSDPTKVVRVYPDGRRIPLSQAEPSPEPLWENFRLGFLTNSGYLRIRGLVPNLLIIDLQDLVTSPNPNLAAIQSKWAELINTLLIIQKPRPEEISAWNKLAADSFMKFTFDSISGKIIF